MKNILFGITLFFASTALGQEPETVYSIALEVRELSWYEQQMQLWKAEIDKNKQNGTAWTNYYMADEVTIPAPTPLVIPRTKTEWYKRSIPLYQVFSGAAVLLICFWVLRNPETTSPRVTQPVKNNTTASQIIYDTIVREIPVIQTAIRYVHDTVKEIQYELYTLAPNREIQVVRKIEPIPLTDALLKSKAPSLKEDKSGGLLTQCIESDRFSR